MNILVTGGAGFVGSSTIKELHGLGMRVTILDNLMSGEDIDMLTPYASCYVGDIRDQELVDAMVRGVDIVAHLAGVVGAPACDLNERLSFDINVKGTQILVNAMKPGQKLINISSTSVYGDKAGIFVNESTPPAPLSSYGRHKLLAEDTVHSKNHIEWITFRPATAFGVSERIRIDLLPNTLIYEALVDGVINLYQGSVIRPFIHVRDFARAIAWAATGNMKWNEIYNLGNKHLTMTKKELAYHICEHTGAIVNLIEGSDQDMRNYDVDFSKLLNTGFRSSYFFHDGIEEIKQALDNIKNDYSRYNTVYNTRLFLEKTING